MSSSATFDLVDAARWIDVILVVAAAPFVLLMGAPVTGYVAAALGWVATRVAGHLIERRAQRTENPRTAVGLMLFGGLGRAWAMGLIIVVVGVAGERQDGLTAAVLAFVAFSVYLAARISLGPQRRKPVSS
jgi:hypothetical protein